MLLLSGTGRHFDRPGASLFCVIFVSLIDTHLTNLVIILVVANTSVTVYNGDNETQNHPPTRKEYPK